MKTADISGPVEPQVPVAPKPPKVKKKVQVPEGLGAEAIMAQNMKEVLAYLMKYGVKGRRAPKD